MKRTFLGNAFRVKYKSCDCGHDYNGPNLASNRFGRIKNIQRTHAR